MQIHVLNPEQAEILPYFRTFRRKYYLVGGTAIALHLGHRRSIDFDLFTPTPLVKSRLKIKLREWPFSQVPLFEDIDQYHLMVNQVKVTFMHFPFVIEHPLELKDILTVPSLLTLASMKAFALGRRAKWKDYVDLYFILRDHYSIDEISTSCNTIFGNQYAEKLFRQQLAYHEDIDFSEPVDFIEKEIPEKEIKEFLVEKAIRFI